MWSDGTRLGDRGRTVSFATVYRSQPAVAAATNKLTRQIASLPLKVYRTNSAGEREEVANHPLVGLLAAPMPRRGPVNLKQWLAMPALVHGNALLAKFRPKSGPPTGLVPLDWRYVSGYAAPAGPVEWWGFTAAGNGEELFLDAEESVHFAWQAPEGEVGVSPLEQLGATVDTDDMIRRHTAASFRNGARPASALVPPPGYRWQDGEKAELRQAIKAQHGGPDKSFDVALLGGGFDWKILSFSAVEAQLLQQRQLHREEVNAVYDVAGPLAGDLAHGTYSNVSELGQQLYKITLRPWLALLEETLQAQLIDPEPEWQGLSVRFDLGEVLRGSRSEEIAAARDAFTNGLMTLNEARAVLQLPKIDSPGADVPQLPVNNLAPLDSQPPPGGLPPPVDPALPPPA